MLDIKLIREQPDKIKEGLNKKNADASLVDKVLELDNKKRDLLQEIETVRAKKNATEKKLIEEKDKEKIIQVLKQAKDFLSLKEKELAVIEDEYIKTMSLIPNPPLDSVPEGKDDTENVVIRQVGKKPKFNFVPQDYLTLGESLDMIDIKRAAKTSGSRFGILRRGGAILEFALIKFIFDKLTKKGFIPIIPPVLIKPRPFWGMGYLDRGAEEVYHLPKDDLYLVGTSEQMIGPMHMDEVFDEEDLPCRYVSFSSCFRREAGSYGKDTKGILRVHQFDKIEMFVFCKPEDSIKEHEFLLSIEEEIMKDLKIPYQVLDICAGDLGDPAVSKYDIEAWLPGQNKGQGQYRETHSASNCTDFQSRRLNIKFKNKHTGKSELVHTLNGTALALGRGILSIIENYQTKDGRIKVPRALWRYTNGTKIFS
ncbi:MAG: serine--tRNA ligase [Candidatus Pacebacteria bacterium]|jgi:seryl-tRNA synthetase|nr:serine--tRNA ligase [Candidatus Paceibacterota bacterium]MDD4994619.1 serine--tRNA ligase [Candidatus Paceibacterota bacterium]MDD5535261.1 serine--tRNA ligase [Candidatus Paceibacterota bacterium]